MADKNIIDLIELGANTALTDYFVIYDASGTEDMRISMADLARAVFTHYGYTGSPTELNVLDGSIATTLDFNKLQAITASYLELNVLDGYLGSVTELNYLKDLYDTAVSPAEFSKLNGVVSAITGIDEGLAYKVTNVLATGNILFSGRYVFDTTGGAITATLVEIKGTQAMRILLHFGTDGGTNVTIRDAVADAGFIQADGTKGTQISFANVDNFILLESSCVVKGYWIILGGNGYVLT